MSYPTEFYHSPFGPTERVLQRVANERKRQDEMFSFQHHTPVKWLAILAEEFGEAAKECVEFTFANGGTWTGDGSEYTDDDPEGALANFCKELIETAAVCVAIVEDVTGSAAVHKHEGVAFGWEIRRAKAMGINKPIVGHPGSFTLDDD